MPYPIDNKYDRAVRNWLFLCLLLVAAMIVLGGATRLTNSGLSITEWAPIRGALPPLSHEAWLSEFAKYQKIPEFAEEHFDMDIDGFKYIYFWEWSHRQLGRLIGLAYALPLFFFAARRRLPRGQGLKFFGILCIIGVQGAIGWWMVASGLVNDRVDVSQYRLATHLGVAFLILASLYWLWRNQCQGWPSRVHDNSAIMPTSLLALLVFVQIIAGAFVAGLKAGRIYNTWPMMDGDFVPDGYGQLTPFWRNIFENIPAVQFNHRILAYVILLAVLWVFFMARQYARLRSHLWAVGVFVTLQVTLGIYVLLTGDALKLALLHQFTAILVWLSVVSLMRAARKA